MPQESKMAFFSLTFSEKIDLIYCTQCHQHNPWFLLRDCNPTYLKGSECSVLNKLYLAQLLSI